jgi:folylpolyglutamate synthase/dihydropteroate synthase
MPKDTINSYTIRSGGNFTIDSTNGEIKSIPTSYTFGNDISHGEIDNSIKRVQHLSRVEHIKTNHNITVDGTS